MSPLEQRIYGTLSVQPEEVYMAMQRVCATYKIGLSQVQKLRELASDQLKLKLEGRFAEGDPISWINNEGRICTGTVLKRMRHKIKVSRDHANGAPAVIALGEIVLRGWEL